MKNIITSVVMLLLASTLTSTAYARNTQYFLPINVAMSTPAAQQKLDGSVKFYFGNQSHPRVIKNLDSDYFNRKTNALNKTDQTACNWVFLSSLLALQDHAHKVGANAVINIVSYYDKNIISNPTYFECHAGALIAGVALKGDFVRLATKN